jgi:ABC-type uncharacterized transport system permease subunit
MFYVRAYKRQVPLRWRSCFVFLGAVGFSLAVSALMLALQGKPALAGVGLLFQGAWGSLWAVEDCLLKAVPIFLCSLGVAIAFRLQFWNIGAEGQFAFGAIGATWMALSFPSLPWFGLLPLMALASFLLGGAWGLVPAYLKLRARANEIIVSLMLNYIAILFLDYLVYGRWKDPRSFGFPMTREFPAGAIIAKIAGSNLHWGLVLCVISGLLVWTRLGFEFRAAGENRRATRYANLPYERLVALAMLFSGAFAGWAGYVEAAATMHRLQPSIMVGYGYTAIVVAWLARLNPLAIGLTSFLLAALRVGVENMQLELQVPAAFGGIVEGLILLSVLSGSFFIEYGVRLRRVP